MKHGTNKHQHQHQHQHKGKGHGHAEGGSRSYASSSGKQEHCAEFKDFNAQISDKANDIIFNVMPAKIMALQQLCESTPETASFVVPEEGAPVLSDQNVLDMMSVVKSEVLVLLSHLSTLKLWIQLNIPRVEDGNNFGVSIQEDMVGMLDAGRSSSLNVMSSASKYHVNRAKIASKILKYPFVEDYRRSLSELDEKEYLMLRHCCNDLRNTYAVLYDTINKNFQKLVKPRNSHESILAI